MEKTKDKVNVLVTHFSILAWEIPWTEEPGGLYSPWGWKSWTQLSDYMTTCTGKCHLCMENRHNKMMLSYTSNCVCSVSQFCPILWDPVDCSSPGSSVHGILQARILEQTAISFSRGSFWSRDQTHFSFISCIGRQKLYHQAT